MEQPGEIDFHNLERNKVEIKDFLKLNLSKAKPGEDQFSICVNRVKNKDIYDFGGFMDKDIPLYSRLRRCRTIIGLEHEQVLGAKILIDLNERLGEYDNSKLKEIVSGKRRRDK